MKRILYFAISVLLVACGKETLPSERVLRRIPYSAGASEAVLSKASLNGESQYVFCEGDRLYVCAAGADSDQLFGILDMVSGAGATDARFEGDLFCDESFTPSADTPVSVTLVSAGDRIHTVADGRVIGTSYPADAHEDSFAHAVERLSDFTATGVFGDREFVLNQQSSFLLFTVALAEAEDGAAVTLVLRNHGGAQTLCTASCVAVETDGVTTVAFTAALPGGTTLSDAALEVMDGGSPRSFGVSDFTLAPNAFYTIDRAAGSEYFTVQAIENGTQITFQYAGADDGVQYSLDQVTWIPYQTTDGAITLNAGEKVFFRGKRSNYASINNVTLLTVADNRPCYVYGNFMSLLCTGNYVPSASVGTDAFRGAFRGATWLRSHPSQKMVLPATQLGQSCYREMFYGCTGLVTGPELPATELAVDCYYHMFRGCTSLSSAVVLPARTMVSGCYFATFYDCKALTSVTCMLETAPTQAEKVANLDKWFKNITVRGSFKCPAAMVSFWNSQRHSSATNIGSIPSSWTVQAVSE